MAIRMYRTGLYTVSILLFIMPATVIAATAENPEGKVIEAVRAEVPPEIDGVLDDECWKRAKPATGFTQQRPDEFEPAKEQTFAYVAYDKDNLYVAFNCLESNPDKIVDNITSRDELMPRGPGSDMLSYDDAVQVLLDTFHDRRNYYSFIVNPRGTQTDGKSGGSMFGGGTVWDCIWDAEAKTNDDGWSVEMAIPFCYLRFKSVAGEQTWGINFRRSEKARGEETYWSRVDEDISSPHAYGILTELKDLSVKHFLNVIPFFVARNKNDGGLGHSEGVDFEALVTPNLTATATFNPDFGQIEADPERFNLSRREEELPEKRPFFKEGLELFNTPISVLYTRRMADIKNGTKLAGKIGPTAVAALNVQTNADEEEPAANFTSIRLKQDVMESASMGVIAVNKYREGISNRIFGVDGNFRIGKNIRGEAQVCKSFFPGMSDTAIMASVVRRSRHHFIFSRYEGVGPDFVAEPGFITQRGEKQLFMVTGGGLQPKRYGIEEIGTFNFLRMGTNYDNKIIGEGFNTNFDVRFENKLSIGVSYEKGTDVLEKKFRNNSKEIEIGYNTKEWTSSRLSFSQGMNYDQKMKRIQARTRLKPTESLSMEIDVDSLRLGETVDWINTLRLNYQFTRDMSLRVFGQMSLGKLTVNSLFRYEYQPGSNLYIAYNQFETDDGTDRVIFVKMTYLLGTYLDF